MATVTITPAQRENLLCCALEGGSNYWYTLDSDADKIVNSVNSDHNVPYVTRMWAAIVAGKEIPIRDLENPLNILGKISLASIDKGEQIMADKYPQHLADILSENEGAITGDVWFQLAVMGEIICG